MIYHCPHCGAEIALPVNEVAHTIRKHYYVAHRELMKS